MTLGLFCAAMALLAVWTFRANGGHLVYGLDDPYIHMSIARSLAQHGDWGLGPGLFSSASSSPFWVLLLALADLLFGVREWMPFALNTLFALLLLILFDHRLKRSGRGSTYRFWALLVLAFGAPLPALIFGGMEHLAHAFFAVLCLGFILELLPNERSGSIWALLLCSFLLVATRFEGLFIILPAALLFGLRHRFGVALALLAAAFAPLLVYALFSLSQGGAWLPDPILLKGKGMDLDSAAAWWSSFWGPLFYHLRSPLSPFSVHVQTFILLGVLLWLVRRRGLAASGRLPAQDAAEDWRRQAQSTATPGQRTPRGSEGRGQSRPRRLTEGERGQWALFIFVAAFLAQFCFAGTGYFFRYESWLVIVGIFLLADLLPEWASNGNAPHLWGRWRLPLGGLILILLVALAARGGVALHRIPRATHNIYSQQYQMGLFLKKHYGGESVALNDIGATCYLAPVRSLDLFGHSHREIGRLRSAGVFDAEQIASFTKAAGCRIAVIYEIWFEDLPEHWIKVGEWTIRDNVVCAHDTVSFFAMSEEENSKLHIQFFNFSRRQLPEDVDWRIIHNESD